MDLCSARVADAAPQSIEEIIGQRNIRMAFQPLVHLGTGEVVAFEALARGPRGSEFESPLRLFEAAESSGRVGELDWICRSLALEAGLSSGLDPSISWFVNVEPSAMSAACPDDALPSLLAARDRLRVVVEFAEREIAADPARLLRSAREARSAGWAIALDDVGADPASLAMLPFVQPDVVKLDMSLLHGSDARHMAAVSNAVRAYAEETGATILAEGIETPVHERSAQVLGAGYGQGWLYGRPGPLPVGLPSARFALTPGQSVPADPGTPYSLAAGQLPVARATKELLLPMSRHLEYQAMAGGESFVLLGCFQHARHYTRATRDHFERLAGTNAFTAALAAGMGPGGSRVATVDLAGTDPLVEEWDVIVVGPHFAGALIARDCGDGGPDMQRRFDYSITHDRHLVVQAARGVLSRVTGDRPHLL